VASVGSFIFGLTQLLIPLILYRTIKHGKLVDAQVWEGASGLVWTTPSPAPYHTFVTPPVVPKA
jgi:cytochrome c oxidase subunit 1